MGFNDQVSGSGRRDRAENAVENSFSSAWLENQGSRIKEILFFKLQKENSRIRKFIFLNLEKEKSMFKDQDLFSKKGRGFWVQGIYKEE
eukprot:snap_masked-scaffold_2-processed-gene-4.25-mRNA-1 protein AED:1.00 eAED:1.00 QI:0/0/0/0/1/1/2/0/88